MSFTTDARSESARIFCAEPCCANAELSAALLVSDGISIKLGSSCLKYSLSITAGDAIVLRHYYQMLKQHFAVTCEMQTLRSNSLNGQKRYRLLIPEEYSEELLKMIGLYDMQSPFCVSQVPSEGFLQYSCCKKSFIKSTFLICGTVINPEKGYHFEMVLPSEEYADLISRSLEYFGISTKRTKRKTKYIVYSKRCDDISDILSLLESGQSVLTLQNIRIKKNFNSNVKRLYNCDNSNIERTTESAVRQIKAIERIEKNIGIKNLPDNLRMLAQARIDNPDAPLSVLGEMMSPPIGKSGVNARFRRIERIAERYTSTKETEK